MVKLRVRRAHRLLLLSITSALLVAVGCSQTPEPTTGRLLVPSKPAIAAPGDTETTENTVARQAGEPSVGRTAGSPTLSPTAPVLHIVGSVQAIADPAGTFTAETAVVSNDLATIATLGCAISTCPPEQLAQWAGGQLQIMNVATLRAAIEGPDALANQIDALEDAGVATLGYGDNIAAASEPIIVSTGGQMVAIHAISLAPDTQSLATETTAGVAGPAAIDLLRESVIANRNDGRGVVVFIDWGNLDGRSPNAQQLDDVDRIINAGADAIVGHGSDFLQRFDLVGQTAVAFSLGNSTVTTAEPLRADTAVLRLEFDTPGRSCLLPATATPTGPFLDDPSLTTCER